MEKDTRMYLRPGKVAEYFEIGCMGYLISEGHAPTAKYYLEEENETVHSEKINPEEGDLLQDVFKCAEEPDSADELNESEIYVQEGIRMQDELLAKMREAGLVLVKSETAITSYDELYQLIESALGDKEEGSQIYLDDISFDLNLTEYSCEKHEACWSVFRPDLIRVTKHEKGEYKMEVIDIKSSRVMRIEHKMQVAIYVYLLNKWLNSVNRHYSENNERNYLEAESWEFEFDEINEDSRIIKLSVDDEVAYIQLAADDKWEDSECLQVGEAFDVSVPIGMLKDFIKRDLNGILKIYETQHEQELPGFEKYIFSSGCMHCSCKDQCFKRAQKDADIRLFPSISVYAQKEWIDLGLDTSLLKKDGSLLSFDEFTDYCEEHKEILCCNPFWEANLGGNREIFRKAYEAYVTKLRNPVCTNAQVDWDKLKNGNRGTAVIPRKSDISVFIHLKITRGVGGVLFISKCDMLTKVYNQPEIVEDWKQNERRDVIYENGEICSVEFINAFYELMSYLFAKTKYCFSQVSIFTASRRERNCLYEILFVAMESEDENLASKAKELLFYFQSENYILADVHPRNLLLAPIVSVLEQVGYLYAIPCLRGISIDDVLCTFGLESETGELSVVEQLECIVSSMQQNDAERLCAPKWIFRKPQPNGIHNRYLSQMHYMLLNEKMAMDKEYYKSLMASTEEMIESKNAISLFDPFMFEADGEHVIFRGRAYDSQNKQMFISEDWDYPGGKIYTFNLGEWILIPDDDRTLGLLRQAIIQGRRILTAKVIFLSDETGTGHYEVDYGNDSASDLYISFDQEGNLVRKSKKDIDKNQKYIAIRPKPEDFTTSNMLEDIISMDRKNPADYTGLSWCPAYDGKVESVIDEDKIRNEYGKLNAGNKETFFTDSQFDAFKQFYNHNITLLQGPPGTGKTDFIARTLIAMARMHREKMENGQEENALRVYISANSHAAINNVLNKVASYLEDDYIKLIKCRNSGEETMEVLADQVNTRAYRRETMYNEAKEAAMIIIGGTNWFLSSLNRTGIQEQFDYVIVDEASQMNSYQALNLFANAKKNAKYMIVGDPLQLPAILLANYRKCENDISITSSVYDLFASLPGKESYHKMIVEDFRMNRVLMDYVRGMYKGYKPYNFDIEERSLDWWDNVSDDNLYEYLYRYEYQLGGLTDLMRDIIDGEKPLIVCYISGDNALQKQQCAVELVKRITQLFYGIYREELPERYGVIIPYHKHIDDVRNAIGIRESILDGQYENHILINGKMDDIPKDILKDLVIDTVDKLQGQERDIVVCSYGASEQEHILNEMEFVYSLNRLNVSLTRARKKCVLILSDTLADRPIEYLNLEKDDPRAQGIDFMCNLKEYMEHPLGLTYEGGGDTVEPQYVWWKGPPIYYYGKPFDDVFKVEYWDFWDSDSDEE